jgi:methionine-gamma-lyase
MARYSPNHGIGTLVTHAEELDNPRFAHISPIFQSTTFTFPDVATGAAIFSGQQKGHYYSRISNPNHEQLARKITILEALDLLRARPEASLDEVAAGLVFASGMAAITSTLLAKVRAGDTIIAQENVYSNTFSVFQRIVPRLGIQVVLVHDISPQGWEDAFRLNPGAVLAYAESPVNPTLAIVDLASVAEIAHRYGAWLVVDNTFATPFCQRPLTLGADLVVHSTTKYLSGHGLIIGGAIVGTQLDFIRKDVQFYLQMLGGSASPFETWLTNIGLKTFELRMQRHCENALVVARYLLSHPKLKAVYYPGLESHSGHQIARRQMHGFGGMVSFELGGGLEAGRKLMNSLRVITLSVSLGTVDSLIEHPASMTHAVVPSEERSKMGITDGLVRFSVGVEDVEDILADLDQGLAQV